MSSAWLFIFVLTNLLVIYCDLRNRRVPNSLIISASIFQLMFLIFNQFDHSPFNYAATDFSTALLGLSVALFFFFPLWHFRAMGAGDVKFIAMLALYIGITGLVLPVAIGSLLAGVHAFYVIFIQGWIEARLAWQPVSEGRKGIPYAAYVAIGALIELVLQPLQLLSIGT